MIRVDNEMCTRWIAGLPEPVARVLTADIEYALEFGRGAALPSVRHAVQQSSHYPAMSEIRTKVTHAARVWVLRVLVVFGDKHMFVCLGGDKAAWAQQHPEDGWYDVHVPIADRIYEHLQRRLH